jgi:hypothetical protein
MEKQSLELGSESDFPGENGVIKRFFSDPVPGQDETSPGLIPDRQGKHPVEREKTILAFILVEMKNDFSIAVGFEGMMGFEILPKLGKVINLPVIDDPGILFLVGHGLMPGGGKIDDGKPAVPEPDRDPVLVPDEDPGIVRSPVGQGIGHPAEDTLIHRLAVKLNPSADSAHIYSAGIRGQGAGKINSNDPKSGPFLRRLTSATIPRDLIEKPAATSPFSIIYSHSMVLGGFWLIS